MYVIESNISINDKDEFVDFQSRIIEVDSWQWLVDKIKSGYYFTPNKATMIGNCLPRNAKVENIEYDDFHLSCDVYNYANMKTKKMFYLFNFNMIKQ